MMYDNWGYGNNGNEGAWGFVFMFFMTLVIVIVIAIFIHHVSASSLHMNHHEAALDVLNKRYARGEIEKKEYDEKRKDLAV